MFQYFLTQTETIDAGPTGPSLRVTRPSQTSADSETLAAASVDEDFARLAKARSVKSVRKCLSVSKLTEYYVCRSNPDILRSTLEDHGAIKGEGKAWTDFLRLHADPGSQVV